MFGKGREIAELRGQVAELREQASTWGSWPGDAGGSTWAGIAIDKDKALQMLAVYGSVRMISDGISTMPVDVYRRALDGTSEPLPTPAWIEEPTMDLCFADWCSQVLTSLLLDGNSYIAVVRNERNTVVELIPLANDRVSVERRKGLKVYMVNGVQFPGELVHIKGLMVAGSDVGLSPVAYARQTIGLGLATEKYGAQFFDGPGNMPGVIEMPRPAQPGMMQETAKAWQKFRKQGGQGLPGVLQDGATWKPTGVTNEDAQFLSTQQWTAAEIAGQMFLLDPSDLGIAVQGTSLTYANLEQRNARRLQVAFLPWMTRIEHALTALLLSSSYVRFNPAGLLRGDLLTQYQAFEIGLRSEFLSKNEVRDKLDLQPLQEVPIVDARNIAEMVQKIYLGVGVVITDEEARQLLNDAGGSFPRALPKPPPPGAVFKGEERDTYVVSPNITVHVPKADAPMVNVAAPNVRVAAPNVTVEAAAPRTVSRHVERDADGRISRIVEEG